MNSIVSQRNAKTLVLAAAFLVASPFAGADPRPRPQSSRADLTRLVVVGDSLSAGFQNFSLFDSFSMTGVPPGGQTFGFASVVAKQAQTSLTLPLISFPGIPPALELTPGGIIRESGFGSRENPAQQSTNLSVPGFVLADVMSHPFPGDPTNAIDALSDVILGTPPGILPGCGPIPNSSGGFFVSEIACAQALKPTTILASAGNNDALQSLTLGLPPTDVKTFAIQYAKFLGGLASTHATVLVANIPDVTSLPFLVPVGGFYQQCGFVPANATLADYVVPNIVNPNAVDLNLCTNYAVRPAALISQTRLAVKQFNLIIAAEAALFGASVVDVNGLVTQVAANGYDVDGRHLTTSFLGGLFSLDGIHPTNTGYAIIANLWINTMNKEVKTHIPAVSVAIVADTDPLVPPRP